ncbi:hypothetical protein KDI_43930 [Dictyobacter arantiisoli]|uniref:Uncharacterized protein n=2 Tax=Dictyobacter arantiisoli TaxID=2014874 RepID=A0A5A5TIL1_9CHLR|nr:hypothetical protein KDI_43930 [Dictyobacter arantiisoli]
MTLTLEALQAHALQPGQRVRLEMEARAGEQRLLQRATRGAYKLGKLHRKKFSEMDILTISAGNKTRFRLARNDERGRHFKPEMEDSLELSFFSTYIYALILALLIVKE